MYSLLEILNIPAVKCGLQQQTVIRFKQTCQVTNTLNSQGMGIQCKSLMALQSTPTLTDIVSCACCKIYKTIKIMTVGQWFLLIPTILLRRCWRTCIVHPCRLHTYMFGIYRCPIASNHCARERRCVNMSMVLEVQVIADALHKPCHQASLQTHLG